MASDTFSEQRMLATDALARAGRFAMRRLHQSGLYKWRYRGRPIEQLVLVPQDLRTADPSFASEIYHGHFGLAGAIGRTSKQSPFLILPPSQQWLVELHGFSWLRHLRAAGDEISREHARALLRDWTVYHGAIGGLPWRPDIVARRIISWLSHLAIALEGADEEFYEDVMDALSRQVRYLRVTYRDMPPGGDRLSALIALMLTGLCADEPMVEPGAFAKAFGQELARQVLADGGHISRNPVMLVKLLLDLLPLRQCFIARDQTPPEALGAAINKMMPMLRFFRLGDGSLAHFNGAGATAIDEIVNALAYDDADGAPLTHAEASGYCRLEQGSTRLIADVGRPPPFSASREAHAGCLSFEVSSGAQPMIVNCGALNHVKQEWRLVARTTAAHSTLSLANTSSSRFLSLPLVSDAAASAYLLGPEAVNVTIRRGSKVQGIDAFHDGYVTRYGLIHRRALRLMDGGTRILGEDRLIRAETDRAPSEADKGSYALRFHLHPGVRAELASDGKTALLVLPNREGWRLATRSGRFSIDESVFLATMSGRNRSQQIVLKGEFGGAGEIRIPWSLAQSAKSPSKKSARTKNARRRRQRSAAALARSLEEN